MKYELVRLNNNIDKFIEVNEVYSFNKEQLEGTEILKLDNVNISGEIFKNSLDNIELSLKVEGIMVLACAITLKPVDYPFNIEITGELDEIMSEIEDFEKNYQNTLDIFPIIWENILMEVPMRVVSPDVTDEDLVKEGNGWKFITDEEETKSPLSGLIELLDDSEVK